MAPLDYRVNAEGMLTQVSDGWDAFARQNDGRHRVLAADVIGRSLLDFVSDSALRHLWATLMGRVVASGSAITVPFRCDAPGLVRSMEMLIEPIVGGGVHFATRVIDSAIRPAARIIDVNAPHTPERLFWICSWCKRLQVHDRWLHVEEAAAEVGVFEAGALPEITHGLCPSCERDVVAELERRSHPGDRVSAAGVDRRRFDLT